MHGELCLSCLVFSLKTQLNMHSSPLEQVIDSLFKADLMEVEKGRLSRMVLQVSLEVSFCRRSHMAMKALMDSLYGIRVKTRIQSGPSQVLN